MTVPTNGAAPVPQRPYRSVLDRAQDRLDAMKASLEASQRDPIGACCKHCTVPVDTGDTCTFCANYTPPETTAQRLDVLVNWVDLLRHDLNEELQALSATAPLMAVVDIVTALDHLRQVAVLLDRANDALEGDAAEVTR